MMSPLAARLHQLGTAWTSTLSGGDVTFGDGSGTDTVSNCSHNECECDYGKYTCISYFDRSWELYAR